jgi:hypothetical protein
LILLIMLVGMLPVTTAADPVSPAPDSLAGSTVETGDCYQDDTQVTLCFTAYNNSPDDEWLDVVELTFPPGWTVACNSQDAMDSCGNAASMTCSAGGNNVSYTDNNGGYGEVNMGCSWGVCVDVTIPATSGTQSVDWFLSGDDWGGTPHDIAGSLDLYHCDEIGWLEGYVMDSETGDVDPTCTEATVQIGPGGSQIPVDPATGYYGPVKVVSGTYVLTATAPGFSEEVAPGISVIAGMTTTQDFNLWRPVIHVEPPAIVSVTAVISQEVTFPMFISNSGHLPLEFEILELPPLFGAREVGRAPDFRTTWLAGIVEIDPQVLAELDAQGTTGFFVQMRLQADLSPAYGMEDWSARGRYVYDSLRAATRAQAPVIAYAEKHNLAFHSYLINNAVFIEGGTLDDVLALTDRADVKQIRANRVLELEPNVPPAAPEAWGWNLDNLDPNAGDFGMEAVQVWQTFNVFGDGIVVANIDTGVFYEHEALDRQYRGNLSGNPGGPYDHDFDWYHPTSPQGCDGSANPCDNNGHGSGTMGIIAGGTADLSEQIGAAPGARWIACKGCEGNGCSDAALTGCADWIAAPCPLGVAPGDPSCDPDMRPHIVNNSWGGGGGDPWYLSYVNAWRAAGIFPAFSAGNTTNPTTCGALGTPGDYVESFGTAAHNQTGDRLYACGPSSFADPPTCNPAVHDIKPNLNAPTYGRSADNAPGAYFDIGGTSGASPHTAGCVALMWSANPSLIGDIDGTFTVLEQTADRSWPSPPDPDACGQPACASGDYPNYCYGWGYLDCLNAVDAVHQSDLPWVWTDPVTGTVPASNEVRIDVTVHCTETRDYEGTLRVLHNDPCQPPVDVPLVVHCEPPYDWRKFVNGEPWQPGISVTVQTSDVIEIVDVIEIFPPPPPPPLAGTRGNAVSWPDITPIPGLTAQGPGGKHSVSAQPDAVLWEQVISGTSGIVSDDYINTGLGSFAADDFTIPPGPSWEIETIFVDGFINLGDLATNAQTLTWYIYADAGGVPAGAPGDGSEIWSLVTTPADPAVTIVGSAPTLDVVAAQGTALALPPGTYWLSFFPSINVVDPVQQDRWNWFAAGTANGYNSMLMDEGNFGGFPWTPIAGLVGQPWWHDQAFRLEGQVAQPWELLENWDPEHLGLINVTATGGDVDVFPDHLVWSDMVGAPTVVTLTKLFHVHPCTWTETLLWEEFLYPDTPPHIRPVLIEHMQAALWIDAVYEEEVRPGQEASFALLYGNVGGYEPGVLVWNEFPPQAPFVSSIPSPDYVDPSGLWVEWFVGDLAIDDEGLITVTVAISDTLEPQVPITITDGIIGHTGQTMDWVEIIFRSTMFKVYLPLVFKTFP